MTLDATGRALLYYGVASTLAGKSVRFVLGMLCMGVLFLVPAARADETLLSNLAGSNAGGQGIVSSGTLRAVSFTTSGTAFTVSSVTMQLINYISSTDTPVLTFRLNNGSAPSASIFGSLTAPESESNALANFVFTPTSGITLTANTTYWLVIAATSDIDTFSWERSEEPITPTGIATFGVQAISENGGSSWSNGNSGPHTFAIYGTTVPEPGAVFLVGLGLTALLFARKRLA